MVIVGILILTSVTIGLMWFLTGEDGKNKSGKNKVA